jgi:DNA polymerase III alpha subunit
MPPRKTPKRNAKKSEEEKLDDEKLDEEKRKEAEDEEKRKELEKNRIATFAKAIEEQLVLASVTDNNTVKITHHTILIIDDVPVEIFVSKEDNKDNKYSYYITTNKITSSSGDEDDIKFLDLEDISTLVELLTHLEEVKKTYRFLEHKLVCPTEYEFAKNQRLFFPIPSDKCCSVCYDPTIEYTMCNHPICFKCRIKCIFSEKDACPLCRETNLCIFPDILTYTLSL